MTEFEKDSEGNVILKPVIGWKTAPVAEVAVLLQMQYADTPADIETGGKSVQFVLKPQACLDLAATLTRQAKRLLEDRLPPGESPN